jgi:biotin transport system substrate-specific component
MSEIRTDVQAAAAPLAARESRVGDRLLAVAVTVLFTTLGAYAEVSLPGSLVPVTLQSMVVILSGVMLGPTLGAAAMIAYVALGAAGVPVFAGGGAGIGHLFGPTGGYLLAFPAAAASAGLIAGRVQRDAAGALRLLAGLTVGSLVIFAGGVPWLAFYTGSVERAIAAGFTPFLLGSVIKLVGAFAVAWRLRERTLRLL